MSRFFQQSPRSHVLVTIQDRVAFPTAGFCEVRSGSSSCFRFFVKDAMRRRWFRNVGETGFTFPIQATTVQLRLHQFSFLHKPEMLVNPVRNILEIFHASRLANNSDIHHHRVWDPPEPNQTSPEFDHQHKWTVGQPWAGSARKLKRCTHVLVRVALHLFLRGELRSTEAEFNL